jgi:uncharacterized OsmC-like protein
MRAVTTSGKFTLVVDEPESAGGTDTGPQPTDLFLASVTSCFALAVAWAARKRDVELVGLEVTGLGHYEGLRFDRITLTVSAENPPEVLSNLIADAERVCYVSNSLREPPELTVEVGSPC